MVMKRLLTGILMDEHLTQGLHDPEARILIEWLVACAERWAERGLEEEFLLVEIQRLCRRARAIGLFVRLWCHQQAHGSACQLAATERFPWPLPAANMDPCDLISNILAWEEGCSAA
jgi:hypothetical protein